MQIIRWMVLVGFAVFFLGAAFTYFDNNRIGFSLGIIGFALALLGAIGGNWVASQAHSNQRYGRAHRIAVVGFCIAILGMVCGEFFPDLGNVVLVFGLSVMFFGFLFAVWSINRRTR